MSRFILSCTTCATRGVEGDEVLACLKYAPRAGYKHWGIAGPPLWSLGGARWFCHHKVNELAEEAGMEGCTEVYGPQFPTDSVEAAEDAASDIALMFDLADALGAPFVVISGGPREPADGLAATIAGLRRLLPMIESRKARLALEPHVGSRFQDRSDYDAIFSAIDHPKLGITVDTGHFHTAGVDWKSLIRDYPSKIWNIHLKDHRGPQSVPIGEGEIDLRGLIETLHEIDYDGPLAVELEVVDPQNLPQYVADAFNQLREMVREVTGRDPE